MPLGVLGNQQQVQVLRGQSAGNQRAISGQSAGNQQHVQVLRGRAGGRAAARAPACAWVTAQADTNRGELVPEFVWIQLRCDFGSGPNLRMGDGAG